MRGAEPAGGDSEGGTGGAGGMTTGGVAGNGGDSPDRGACKGLLGRPVWLMKVGAGTVHREPVPRAEGIVRPVRAGTCLQVQASIGLQDWKSPDICRPSRNFGGNGRLMEDSARQVLELVEGCNDPPGVALGLVCTVLQPRAVVLDQGAGTGGGGAAAVVPAAHSPRQELSSCCS